MEDYGQDWDLAAIVRSCFCSPTSTSTKRRDEIAAYSPLIVSGENDGINGGRTDQVKGEEIFFGFSTEKFEWKSRSFEGEAEGGLEVLCNPFLSNNAAADAANSRFQRVAAAPSQNTAPQAKRRKKQLKKVFCQVPADGVSLDVWSWRKYGQKPIKGSPFPRGYYRCSTIRGCPARKQVERDQANPGQLIISYTSEHNHPVPTHHKFCSTAPSKRRGEESIPTSPATSVSMDNDEQEKEQEEETLMVEDMELIGEDELILMGGNPTEILFDDDDGLFADRIFASPWLEKSSNNNATAAAC